MVLTRDVKSTELASTSSPVSSRSRSPSIARFGASLSPPCSDHRSNIVNSSSSAHSMLSLSIEEDPEFKRFVYLDETSSPCPGLKLANDDLSYEHQEEARAGNAANECRQHESNFTCVYPSTKSATKSDIGERDSEISSKSSPKDCNEQTIELRFLVRRREAGALIGKKGTNIKRLRELFRSSMFSIPDTGNGPERIVCIATNEKSINAILSDLTQLLMEKSPENDEQIELKLLINSSHAGSIIGIGGQSIKKLRNDSKAAIKIYEMCCPLSNERVCAIKAKPSVVVSTIKLIQSILNENPTKGTIKPYDALHFDLNLVDKYGGYLPDEASDIMNNHHTHRFNPLAYNRQFHDASYSTKHYSVWRSPEFHDAYEIHDGHELRAGTSEGFQKCLLEHQHHEIPNLQPSQSGMNCMPKSKGSYGDHGGVIKRETADCEEQKGQPTDHSARPGRFHPYAPVTNQLEFPSCARTALRHQLPINAYNRLQYGSVQNRGQYIRVPNSFPNLPERCRHVRPCLCMFLPMLPDVLSTTTPYIQMAKNFNYSRSSTHGYKKK